MITLFELVSWLVVRGVDCFSKEGDIYIALEVSVQGFFGRSVI